MSTSPRLKNNLSKMISQLIRNSAVLVLAIAVITTGVLGLQSTVNRRPQVALSWLYIPQHFEAGSPFFALAKVQGREATEVFLQLRICAADGTCVHSSRQPIDNLDEPAIVTARRDLRHDDYLVQVLVQTRTYLGVVRTVASGEGKARYGS